MHKKLMTTTALLALSGMVFADAGLSEQQVAQFNARLEEIAARTKAIMDAGDNITDAQVVELETLAAESKKIATKLRANAAFRTVEAPAPNPGRQTVAEPVQPQNRPQQPNQPNPSNVQVRENPHMGFQSFGEFALTVWRNSVPDGRARDTRLIWGDGPANVMGAASSYGSEGVGADGGFLVPPVFREAIWTKVMAEENLLARCAQLTTSGNSLTIPKDETAPWDTTNGIQVYWESEAGVATQSKPAFNTTTLRLNKLFGLVPITEELQADAPGLESWLMTKAPQKISARINTALITGNGVGKPLGILNAAALITVAAEGGQAADTVLYANIVKMWARMYAPCRRNAIWLINQDIEPQLDQMAFLAGAASPVPVYLPQNSITSSPYAALKGRPVVPLEACPTLGDVGDIILADMNQYWALTKSGQALQTDTSMHLFFDQAITAFRFIFRVSGQPAWGGAINPENGAVTRSCFVALAAR